MSYNLSNLLYLITIVSFVLALRFLSSPAHARRGNQIGAAGDIRDQFRGVDEGSYPSSRTFTIGISTTF